MESERLAASSSGGGRGGTPIKGQDLLGQSDKLLRSGNAAQSDKPSKPDQARPPWQPGVEPEKDTEIKESESDTVKMSSQSATLVCFQASLKSLPT